jgi:outer membrane biosynthesis protein TonB
VIPAARAGNLRPPHAAANAAATQIPDEVIRRKPQAAQPPDHTAAGTEAPPAAASSDEDTPSIAASSAAAGDLGKVIETPPALPKLTVPISQGTAGGVLLRKVQPVYPPEARRLRMTGSVVIDATVNLEGQVDDLKLISGDARLAPAAPAVDCRNWRREKKRFLFMWQSPGENIIRAWRRH